RCRKACWVIRGHCRKYCKSGERVKKPCNNGDYCCTVSRMDTLPQAPTKNFKNSKTPPVMVFLSNN
uniref:Beta-defensin n=1 Tax=Cricetulus griseus TaxID=10029 RepID=A0A8C2LTA8_CRIGR